MTLQDQDSNQTQIITRNEWEEDCEDCTIRCVRDGGNEEYLLHDVEYVDRDKLTGKKTQSEVRTVLSFLSKKEAKMFEIVIQGNEKLPPFGKTLHQWWEMLSQDAVMEEFSYDPQLETFETDRLQDCQEFGDQTAQLWLEKPKGLDLDATSPKEDLDDLVREYIEEFPWMDGQLQAQCFLTAYESFKMTFGKEPWSR